MIRPSFCKASLARIGQAVIAPTGEQFASAVQQRDAAPTVYPYVFGSKIQAVAGARRARRHVAMKQTKTAKEAAYNFLKQLEKRLNGAVPSPIEPKSMVDAIWQKPKHLKTEREKIESKKNVPFFFLAIPQIFELAKTEAALTDAEMRKALRCVYYGKFPEFSTSNVFRKSDYPFSKKWGLSTNEVMRSWQKPQSSTVPANQAWPEAGLVAPFPWRILFEAKYFEEEGLSAAESSLVSGVDETAFYRGLPADDDWSYDFGCLPAYDVSENGYLKQAWESVVDKRLFWEHGHLFVMIVRSPQKGRGADYGEQRDTPDKRI